MRTVLNNTNTKISAAITRVTLFFTNAAVLQYETSLTVQLSCLINFAVILIITVTALLLVEVLTLGRANAIGDFYFISKIGGGGKSIEKKDLITDNASYSNFEGMVIVCVLGFDLISFYVLTTFNALALYMHRLSI